MFARLRGERSGVAFDGQSSYVGFTWFDNLHNYDAIYELVTNFFLFWYGIYWHNPEDIGIAVGNWVKVFTQLSLDEISRIKPYFICPVDLDRDTYDDWIIGTW